MKTFFICSTILASAIVVSSSAIAIASINKIPDDAIGKVFDDNMNITRNNAEEEVPYSFQNDN